MLSLWTLLEVWKVLPRMLFCGVPTGWNPKVTLVLLTSGLPSYNPESLLPVPTTCSLNFSQPRRKQERETKPLGHLKDTEQIVLPLSLGACKEGWMSPCPPAHNLKSTHNQVLHNVPSVGMPLTGSPVRAGSSLLNEANHLDPKTISMQPLKTATSVVLCLDRLKLRGPWSQNVQWEVLFALQISDSWACPSYSPLILGGSNGRNLRIHLCLNEQKLQANPHPSSSAALCSLPASQACPPKQQHGPQPFVLLCTVFQTSFVLRTCALSQPHKTLNCTLTPDSNLYVDSDTHQEVN